MQSYIFIFLKFILSSVFRVIHTLFILELEPTLYICLCIDVHSLILSQPLQILICFHHNFVRVKSFILHTERSHM